MKLMYFINVKHLITIVMFNTRHIKFIYIQLEKEMYPKIVKRD